MQTFLYIILAIIILMIMIMIHEFGHYAVGKLLKFKINEFSVGFGPTIFSKTSKKSGELFSVRAIPLGGYCAFENESGIENEINEKSFTSEKPWKRILVFIAGPMFNFISAIIFSFIFILIAGYSIPNVVTIYNDSDGVPFNSQLAVNDKIIAVNGNKIGVMQSYQDLLNKENLDNGDSVILTIDRNGEIIDIKLVKQHIITEENNKKYDYYGFGFSSQQTYKKGSFVDALLYSVPYTCKLSWSVLKVFGQLIIGKVPLKEVTGPIGTVDTMAKIAMLDWRNLFMLLPLIASNLAVFNLLPIPALDGSKVVFTAIEWVRGKPINRKIENYIHMAGVILIFGFIIVIDIIGLFLR